MTPSSTGAVRTSRPDTTTMRLEGIHHVTCITGDAPRQRRLLHPRARAAARQEDGQPGRPDRLPPLLRGRGGQRRGRHHVLRVPGRPSRPSRRRDGAHRHRSASAPRRRSTSGRSASPRRASQSHASRAGSRFEDPEGLGLELAVVAGHRRAARRAPPGDPGRARAAGLRRRPRLQRATPGEAARSSRTRSASRRPASADWEVRGAARGGLYGYDPPPPGRRPRRRHRPPRRLGVDDGGARGLAAPRRRGRDAPDAGDRPLLLPLDLLPRAERRPLRDRDARPGLHDRRGPGAPRRALILPPAFEHLRDRRSSPCSRRCPTRAAPGRRDRRDGAGTRRPAPRERREPEGALVLLHGRGADEHDLFPLLDLARPGAAAARHHAARAAHLPPGGATGTRSAGSRRPTRRPSTRRRHSSRHSSTGCRCRWTASSSAASRRAR